MTNHSKNRLPKAFSLVEISVVIVIIGILIAGIAKATDLYQEYRLTNAQNLTRNSVVNRIGDIVAWYETSLPSSFKNNEYNIDNGSISIWNDNNNFSTLKNNATAKTPLNIANQPKFIKNAFNNSIPGLRFSGAQEFDFNGTPLANSNYTIFVVEQRSGSNSKNYFICGRGFYYSNLHLGYRSNTTITHAHYIPDLNVTVEGFTSKVAKIHTFLFGTSIGKYYSSNGSLKGSSPSQTNALQSYIGAGIGGRNGDVDMSNFNGDIAEIIMFNKALKASDIKAVENYLGTKYSIVIAK